MQNPSSSAVASSSIARFGFIGTPVATEASVSAVPFGLQQSSNSNSVCNSQHGSQQQYSNSASAPLCFAPSTVPPSGGLAADYNNSNREAVNGNEITGSNNKNNVAGYCNDGGQYKSSATTKSLLPGLSQQHQSATNRNRASSSHNQATKIHQQQAPQTSRIAEYNSTFNCHSSSSSPSIVKSARSLGQIPSSELTLLPAPLTADSSPTNWSSDTSSALANSSRISSSLLPSLLATSSAANTLVGSSLTYSRSRTKSLESPDIAISAYAKSVVDHQQISRSSSSSTSSGIKGASSSNIIAIASSLKPSLAATSLHQLNSSSGTTNPLKMSAAGSSSSSSKLPNHRLIKSQSLRFDSTNLNGCPSIITNGQSVPTSGTLFHLIFIFLSIYIKLLKKLNVRKRWQIELSDE